MVTDSQPVRLCVVVFAEPVVPLTPVIQQIKNHSAPQLSAQILAATIVL